MTAFLGEDDSVACVVVVNDRGQYSIWPRGRDVPPGWRSVGVQGTRAQCLSHIEEVWDNPTGP